MAVSILEKFADHNRAETSDGSIRLEHGIGTVNAKTSDGSIRAQITAQPERDCSQHTSDGSITVTLISNIDS